MNRRLYRSRREAVLGGVAGGVAEWLGWDPSLVRVAWIVLVPFTGGLALLVYLVMWAVVPEEPSPSTFAGTPGMAAAPTGAAGPGAEPMPAAGTPGQGPAWTQARDGDRGTLVVGLILIVIGAVFLVREFVPALDWGRLWPIALVAVGLVILISSLRRRA
jgi:phage shock protein PspC (stress-responsive transcriptional regulator)